MCLKLKKSYRIMTEAPSGVPRTAVCRGCSTFFAVPEEIADVDGAYRCLDKQFSNHSVKHLDDDFSEAVMRIVHQASVLNFPGLERRDNDRRHPFSME